MEVQLDRGRLTEVGDGHLGHPDALVRRVTSETLVRELLIGQAVHFAALTPATCVGEGGLEKCVLKTNLN